MTYRIIFLLLISTLIHGQSNLKYYEIKTIDPIDTSFADLRLFGKLFDNKKVIGVGESTHGTSEFTTLRNRLFKFLINEKQFDTFFLEADFGLCNKINEYVTGTSDSLASAIKGLKLWPWITIEMKELIESIKYYNISHPNKKISVIGCDMQFISDDLKELNIIINKYSKGNTNYFVFDKPDTQLKFDSIGRNQILKQVKQFTNEYKTLGVSDSLEFKIEFHLKSIDQWIKLVTEGKTNYNFRDSCMAENINFYLLNQPNTKGMFFAHNVHVSKLIRKHPKNLIEKSTGTYLFNLIGDKYYSIAQDFYEGEFLAVSFENGKPSLKSFKLPPSTKKSIGYVLNNTGKNILFCESKEIENLNKLKMTFIGIEYGKNKFNKEIERYAKQTSFFDAFLFIRQTKPTTLILK